MTEQSEDSAIRDLIHRAQKGDTEDVAIDPAESLTDIRHRAAVISASDDNKEE